VEALHAKRLDIIGIGDVIADLDIGADIPVLFDLRDPKSFARLFWEWADDVEYIGMRVTSPEPELS
jgi:hypothetical protein